MNTLVYKGYLIEKNNIDDEDTVIALNDRFSSVQKAKDAIDKFIIETQE